MRLVTFDDGSGPRAGVLADENVIALSELDPSLPGNVLEVVRAGPAAMDRINAAMAGGSTAGRPAAEVRLLAPIPRPAKNIFCVGKNYIEHAAEFERSGFDRSSAGQNVPDNPIVFTKAPTSVIGPEATVESALDPTGTLDYEGELGVIIGKAGRGISKDAAYEHVFGYTVINDITARAPQESHRQWFLGKSIDTFCPMGPSIVTADEVADITQSRLITRVNGEVRQDAVVRDLIFDIPTIIATISQGITLEPGDVIATGTPAGVAVGYNPPRYLKPGDSVEVEITPFGRLANPIG